MPDETKPRVHWLNIGAMFRHEVDGHEVLCGGLFGRQCVATLDVAKDGITPMWRVAVLNVGKDHDAAIDLARRFLQGKEKPALSPQPHGRRPTLTLNKKTETTI